MFQDVLMTVNTAGITIEGVNVFIRSRESDTIEDTTPAKYGIENSVIVFKNVATSWFCFQNTFNLIPC